MRQSRPVVAGGARALADVVRVHDQPARLVEHDAGEREALRLRLPEQRQQVVEHAETEQPAGHAELALHRVEVAAAVPAADRDPGDQVVQHVLVQHDDAGPLAQRVDDPAVRVRVVADVVERDVRGGRALARLGDDDLDALAQRRQEQRRVVGDPRARRRQRRVVGDLHDRSASTQASQVTRSAIALPARPHAFASSTWLGEVRAGPGELGGLGRDDDPGLAVVDDLERAAGVDRRHDRLPGEERLVRDHPEVLVERRVVDGEAARVEIGEPLVVDAADELDLAVQPGGEPLEPLAVGPVAGRSRSRSPGSRFAASISRSIRFARSSRFTESTKPSDSAVR